MSIQAGLDLVTVDEVQAAVHAHRDRYLARVYTDDEQRDCGSDPRRLAMRFAAKEAALKALKRSDESIPWRCIEVQLHGRGQPTLALHGAAAELARERGVIELSLSMTSEGDVASALVLAESTP
jgi:holo-[acyl-carrier protein] synthase